MVAYEHLTVVEHPQPVKEFSIQFEKVSFSYPGANQKAVDDVSFTIPQGNTVALVGASGGGKTTIARLVPRFWEATEGKVLIGGINVREIAPEELMKYISFVFQNTKLFKTSLHRRFQCFHVLTFTPACNISKRIFRSIRFPLHLPRSA